MTTDDILSNAIELINAGKKAEAQKLLEPYLETNPQHIEAWLWEAKTFSSIESKIRVLEMCLAQNPGNQEVWQTLVSLNIQRHQSEPDNTPTMFPSDLTHPDQSNLPLETRKIVVQEISNWVRRNLLSEAQAYTIRIQYNFDFSQPEPDTIRQPVTPAPKPATAAPQTPAPTLMQTLLSEASIKIALYLGAFFVIAAALILAALVESLRLPILTIVAVGFCAGALGLKKRLPQPSFILWMVFSALLPINAGVLADLLGLAEKVATTYWVAVLGCMAIFWGFSTWFYRSRFFSLSAFAALSAAIGLTGSLVDKAPVELYFLLLTISGFCGIAGVWLLKRWQCEEFAVPLFVLAHIQELSILFISFLYSLFSLFNLKGSLSGTWWPATTLLWLLATVFFLMSDLVIPFAAFPFLTAGALSLLPWFVLVQFQPESLVYAIGWWSWGALFALAGEALNLASNSRVRQYALPFSLGALGLLTVGAIFGWISGIPLGFMLFLISAVLLTVLHLIQPRWWIWSTALFSGLVAYFLFFNLPGLEASKDYFVYQSAGAALLLLLPDLFLTADLNARKVWRWPVRAYGGLFLAFSTLAALVVGSTEQPLQAVVVFGLFALFFLAFALLYKLTDIGFLFTTYLTLAVIFAIRLSTTGYWLWPLIGLSAFYYISGSVVKAQQQRWGLVLEISGLGLGTFTAFSAPFENTGLGASIPVAVAATLWAIEAFRRRNAWLGFPANGLYLMSYYMILLSLKVDQPQFFSIGAALLGIIMHYLLVRSGSSAGAFMIGMASQLVLLGTTYIQMAGTQDLSFFAALFFQSLVVMVYGMIIRSRSLTFMPIAFVVLGVATVVFSVLKGISTVILIGCTGIIMILLGILAVAMRERLTKAGEYMRDWIA